MDVYDKAGSLAHTAAGAVEYELGEGDAPVMLASHGAAGGVDQARLMLEWLDPRAYRRLAVSRPGYLGTPLSSGRTPTEQADMFAALLDALGIERVAIVSLSAGGPAAYLFAARHPDRLAALVAIDSVSGPHEAPETIGPVSEAVFMSDPGQRLMRTIVRRRPAWALRGLLAGTAHFTKAQLDAHVAHVLASAEARSFLEQFLETMSPYRLRKPGTLNDTAQLRRLGPLPLDQVRCPTLVVHGTHDADVKLHHGVFAVEHIPGAAHHWIDEGDHLGFWLAPQARVAQKAAADFLQAQRRW